MQAASTIPLMELNSIVKIRNGMKLLDGVTLELKEREVAMVVGKSGSGKTTLLRICALVDKEFTGRMRVMGSDPFHDKKDSYLRLVKIGYIPQFHDLLEQLTVIENVELPLLLQGIRKDECRRRATEVIERLGIQSVSNKFPAEISGGEAQRVAIARALVKMPSIIIADEPTSSIDPEVEDSVFREFRRLADLGSCVLVSSTQKDPSYSQYFDSVYFMNSGHLHKEG
ncbi:MAG: ATP-binding cassette domain-containing protein [Conexivisphaerales archaeon]